MTKEKKPLKFIDLYAGLGGFHQALSKLGHKGVWASEYNVNLRGLYKKNFPNTPIEGDIFKVNLKDIPDHDILCGGFPCQPFSRAGLKKGFEDDVAGNHFFKILDIIDSKKKKAPKYIFLENVETILKHDNRNTYTVIKSELQKRNYDIVEKVMSPHEFNIPHHRRRLFIVGVRIDKGGLKDFEFPKPLDISKTSIDSIIKNTLEPMEGENLTLSRDYRDVLNLWAKFIENFPKDKALPGFPIWSHEWGANYPFEEKTPQACSRDELSEYKGKYGEIIMGSSKKQMIKNHIPRYSQKDMIVFPNWKIIFIKKNREFYAENREYIDEFAKNNPQLRNFKFSYQKLEWSCQGGTRNFDDKIIQFRPSGLRVKLDNWAPALTTVRTQNIYIPKLNRKLSLFELSRLQSMNLEYFPDVYDGKYVANGGFKAFGNAVNVEVVKLIAKNLLKNE